MKIEIGYRTPGFYKRVIASILIGPFVILANQLGSIWCKHNVRWQQLSWMTHFDWWHLCRVVKKHCRLSSETSNPICNWRIPSDRGIWNHNLLVTGCMLCCCATTTDLSMLFDVVCQCHHLEHSGPSNGSSSIKVILIQNMFCSGKSISCDVD